MKENFGILSPIIWFILLFVLATFMFAMAFVFFVVNSLRKSLNLDKLKLPKFEFSK